MSLDYPTITDSEGYEWVNRGAHTDDHLAFAGHETALLDIVRNFLPEGGEFLDVGAHVGLWSVHFADQGHVTAIEANPTTYEILGENIARNPSKIKYGMSRYNVAAWDTKDVPMTMGDPHSKKDGGSNRVVPIDTGIAMVTSHRLDDVLGENYLPDLVKIDVEGGEAHVLRGMRDMVQRSRPVLFIEMHDHMYGEEIRTGVLEFLDSENYGYDTSITFSTSPYILAQPKAVSLPEPEKVHAGDGEQMSPEEFLKMIGKQS